MQWMEMKLTVVTVMQVLLLSAAVGSGMLVLWAVVAGMLRRTGLILLLYRLLRAVGVSFLLSPVLMIGYYYWQLWVRGYYNAVFDDTGLLRWAAMGFCGVWLAGCAVGAAISLKNYIRFRRRIRGAYACDRVKQEIFASVCRELGVREGRVRLLECYGVSVPFLTGTVRPRIILPAGSYGETQLRVILLHELTHDRHRDIRFKQLAALIRLVLWFHPLAWWFRRLVGQWCEYACDQDVCGRVGSRSTYFHVIISMAETAQVFCPAVSTPLWEDRDELEARILCLKQAERAPQRSKRMLVGLAVLALCVGIGLAVGISSVMANAYLALYELTWYRMD